MQTANQLLRAYLLRQIAQATDTALKQRFELELAKLGIKR